MTKPEKVDIQVVQKAISVKWECPNCEYPHETPYDEFLDGEQYCDWKGSRIECDICGKEFVIDDMDWS